MNSSKRYLLDTHTWIWWNASPEKLSKTVRSTLECVGEVDQIFLSAISPWELCKLVEKGRLSFSKSLVDWLEEALQIVRLQLVPLTPEISFRSTTLPSPFHDDPADQIIVASARTLDAIVVTKDKLLLNYPHVKSLW